MLVRTNGFEARLAVLEAYVDTPKEPRGMTLTARIDAQHRMLVAVSENQSDLTGRMTRLEGRMDRLGERMDRLDGRMDRLDGRMDRLDGGMDRLEDRMTSLEGRMRTLEGSVGVVLHGVTAIKNMLKPPDDPDEGPWLNGSPLPLN
jgi:predicted nuclease with TOPRIM domain